MKILTIDSPISKYETIGSNNEFNIPSIIDAMKECNDDVMYANPFMIIRSSELIEQSLKKHKMVVVRRKGCPYLSTSLYAISKEGCDMLSQSLQSYVGDNTIPIDANWTYLVLTTFGSDVCILVDDGSLIGGVNDNMIHTDGKIAINTMPDNIQRIVAMTKLNAYDVAGYIMDNVKNERKEPIYD